MGNQIHINTMIYAISQKEAEDKLNEIAENLKEPILKRTRDTITTESKRYSARRISHGCRGYRFLEAYVSWEVFHSSLFNEIVLPCLVPPSYYDINKWGDPYNWREHVHCF